MFLIKQFLVTGNTVIDALFRFSDEIKQNGHGDIEALKQKVQSINQ
jgi:UDP-N-acetylglucosamine 2-epimerase